MTTCELSLQQILDERLLVSHLQPIVSIKRRRIYGVEALARGAACGGGVIVPPIALFGMATEHSALLRLDRLCRETALSAFAKRLPGVRNLVLHVNIDVSVLNTSTVGSGFMRELARLSGVEPGNVAIEIIESRVEDEQALMRFVSDMREAGFLLALDDVGTGHSNLDRIPAIKPDIIKIDRGLITDIDTIYHKQVIASSLVKLAGKIGALVIAEGVERLEEVLTLMEMGVDIFQGWFFAKAVPEESGLPDVRAELARVADAFREHQVARINERKLRHAVFSGLTNEICGELATCHADGYDDALIEALGLNPAIECIYVLDELGRQVSETICNESVMRRGRRLLYQPAAKGSDHSLKDYYLPISAGLPRYTTEPYISLASGNLCQTISAHFEDAAGLRRVLCVDLLSPS